MSKQFQVVGGTLLVFRNLAESLYVLWALSLVECVAVWALNEREHPRDAKFFYLNYGN